MYQSLDVIHLLCLQLFTERRPLNGPVICPVYMFVSYPSYIMYHVQVVSTRIVLYQV